jgi:NAD(P)-dependent dehydrogenase (short-subunit alcohol dehydrogenase family)
MFPCMARNVFLTGVSSGIGLGLAQECLRRGDAVFALGRRPPPADALDPAHRDRFRFAACDLAAFDAIPGAVASLLGGLRRLDLAIRTPASSGASATWPIPPWSGSRR